MFAFALAAAVALLLFADYRESALGVWLAKPLASTVFVAAGVANGALGSGYGRLVLAALALSWLGDVLLIPAKRPAIFQAASRPSRSRTWRTCSPSCGAASIPCA